VPEGHTLHRIARDHTVRFLGRPVAASSPQGRFAEGAALIDGRELVRAEAYGKHLFHDYGAGRVLHVHLGLIGSFRSGDGEPPPPVGAVRLRLAGAGGWADLRGATLCALVTPGERRAVIARLGPDPLRRNADGARVVARASRSRVPVAALLMDQSVLAGVGNVYRAELLFRARIDPWLPGREVDPERLAGLWADLVQRMRAGVRTGRIVTTEPEHRSRRTGPARDDDRHYVYRRTGLPCRVCGSPVAAAGLAGRTLYWCPSCQAPGHGRTPEPTGW
jgi:formamidopyrimidine-DNA glycosylase